MWIGLAIGVLVGTAQGVKSFRLRHEPEPPNSKLKLPLMLLLLGGCLALAASGTEAILFSILALVLVVQIGFLLAGRNPWWMQGSMDRKEYVPYQCAPPHDLDPRA